ncbi:MAG: DUF3445 domain-containing protein [Brucellaceae bacterium]|nr:DUF3445 domain-containing protein [Brucellaceae bacterium]
MTIDLARAFAIGVSPLDLAEWFVIGGDLARYLAEKQRLEAEHGDRVFMAEAETDDAQREVLDLVASHLTEHHPALYSRDGDIVTVLPTGGSVDLGGRDEPALKRAAHLVPDDLVIMRRGESGWRIAAASLCFPSSWSLAAKFGRPLDEVHAPVPDFAAGTRNATLIERMFDNLRPDMPVKRQNWSLYHDAELYHPVGHAAGDIDPAATPGPLYLRRERQTLRKLPGTGDILFTIRILVDPLEDVAASQGGSDLLRGIAAQIEAMTPDQLAYKGMAGGRETILRRLADLAPSPAPAQ